MLPIILMLPTTSFPTKFNIMLKNLLLSIFPVIAEFMVSCISIFSKEPLVYFFASSTKSPIPKLSFCDSNNSSSVAKQLPNIYKNY